MSGERLIAERMNAEQHKLERIGVLASRRMAGYIRQATLRSLKSGDLPDMRPIIMREMHVKLRDAMVAGHVYGIRRGFLQQPKTNKLELGIFDTVLKLIQKRLGLNIDDLQQQYNTQAFKILNDASDNINGKLRKVVDNLIQEGAPTGQAIKVLNKEFDKLGITTKNDFQLETIFRTQTQLTYSAGRWQADQDPDIQEILWGYKYVSTGDDRVREEHEALDGTLLPKDDPFWLRFFPPNGWNCRCQAISIYDERKAIKPPTHLEDGTKIEPDKGFAFNPGIVFGNVALSFSMVTIDGATMSVSDHALHRLLSGGPLYLRDVKRIATEKKAPDALELALKDMYGIEMAYNPDQPRGEDGKFGSGGGGGGRHEKIEQKKGEDVKKYRERYHAAPKLPADKAVALNKKYIDLHNAASKEYKEAFKEVGAKMWGADDAHPLKDEDVIENMSNTMKGTPIGNIASQNLMAQPLTVLDGYKSVTPAQKKSLNKKVDAIHKKYTQLWHKAIDEAIDDEALELSEGPKITDFSSTMFMLDGEVVEDMLGVAEGIDEDDLHEKGLEDEPHITVKYGLHTDKSSQVKKLVKDWGPIEAKLGKLSVFSNPDYDVLKVEVESKDLNRLNRLISQLEHTDSFDDYSPHATIGYLKPGSGEAYAGSWPGEGRTVKLDKLVFSDPKEVHTEIALEYSTDQPRGADGKWIAGAGGFSVMKSGKGTKQVQILKHNADGTFNVKGPKGKVFENVSKHQLGHEPAANHVAHPKAPAKKPEEIVKEAKAILQDDAFGTNEKIAKEDAAYKKMTSKELVAKAKLDDALEDAEDGIEPQKSVKDQLAKVSANNKNVNVGKIVQHNGEAHTVDSEGFKNVILVNDKTGEKIVVDKDTGKSANYDQLKAAQLANSPAPPAAVKETAGIPKTTEAPATTAAGNSGGAKADRIKEFKERTKDIKIPASKMTKIEAVNDFEGPELKVPLVTTPDEIAKLQEKFPDKKIVKVNANKIMAQKSQAGQGISGSKPTTENQVAQSKLYKQPEIKPGSTSWVGDNGIPYKVIGTQGEYYKVQKGNTVLTMTKNMVQSKIQPKDVEPGGHVAGHKPTISDGGKIAAGELTKLPADYVAKREEWTKGLKSSEKQAIKSWSESGYHSIRKDEAAGKETELTKNFHAALAKAPKFEGTTYRGINVAKGTPAHALFTTPGATVSFDSSASTSRSLDKAHGFSNGSIVMRIKGKSGVSMEHISSYSTEKEIIMPKGTKYKVVNVAKNVQVGYGKTHVFVDLEEI